MDHSKDKWKGICKLVEELGELQQVLGKILAYPNLDHPTDNLKAKILEEVADVEAALLYFKSKNLSNSEIDQVFIRSVDKLEKFNTWDMSGIMS